jgi:hypothetical protein
MSTEIQNQDDTDFAIISSETAQQMQEKFIAGLEERAAKAVTTNDNAAGRNELMEALKALLTECARKDIKIGRDELAELAGKGKAAVEARRAEAEDSLHAIVPRGAYPSPKFSDAQKKQQTEAAKERKESPVVQEAFGAEERLYLRLKGSDAVSPLQKQIGDFLEKQGYTITDYNKGYATDAAGKQQFKIGRLLKNEPELYKAFSEDGARSLDSLMVAFSRNTDDIARMSTGRAWSSCMGAGGFNYKYVPADIKQGTLIAYLISEKDPDILNPLARILIKPYVRTKDSAGNSLSETANKAFRKNGFFTPGKRYGIHNDDFSVLVKKFVEERLDDDIYGEFKLEDGLYQDGLPSTISRKDGPALKRPDGGLEWWVKGRLHREDGPAVEHANGGKEWYLNGQLHREDGPALEEAYGYKVWYRNGQRHREDGPAVEKADGAKEWYRNGEHHREDGPAVEKADGAKEWYRNGEYHREDGPAVEHANGDKAWYRNGQYHREDGPAVEKINGSKSWYRDGLPHREGGPAVEHANGDKVWYRNGQRHREGGPAYEGADGGKAWYLNGQRHREVGPATERSDGQKEWHLNGKLHREGGPAIEKADGAKEWFLNGQHHREDGPAVEYANGTKEWYRNGQRHREDGPAIEKADGTKEWYLNGHLHREDGPAYEGANGAKEWYLNGQCHREDGPAVEKADGRKAWFLNDRRYTEAEFNKWREAQNAEARQTQASVRRASHQPR